MNIKIYKGIIINFVITIIITTLTFLVNKYFADFMGAENLGLMKLFTQLVAYLSLADMGLGTASAYALYKPLADKNYKMINIIVSTIESLYNKIAICIIVIGLMFSPILKFLIKDYVIDYKIYLYWSLYVISTSSSYLYAKYNIIFTANQEYNYVRVFQATGKIISQILQIFVIIKYKSFFLFILLLVLDNGIQYYLFRNYYKKNYFYIKKVKQREKKIVKDLMNLFWHKVGSLVVYNTDYIVISSFINLKIVGIYSSYILVTQVIATLIGILTNVINPYVGKYIAENNKENIYSYWKKINIIFLMLGVVLTYTTYKTINSFIELWLGKDFLLPKITIILLSINLLITSTRNIIEIFKNNSGFFEDIYLPIAESIINLVFSVILVHLIGLNGVIIGTIISNIVITCIAKPILVFKKCFEKSSKEYIKISFEYICLVFIVILISEKLLDTSYIINFRNEWITWIINTFYISFVITLISIFIFLLNKDFRMILKKINKKL